MTLQAMLTQPVTILTPGTGASRYGDASKDWDTATSVTTSGWMSQTDHSEDATNREAEIAGWVLFLGPDEVITGRCRVVWSGLTFEVVGPPRPAYTPRGLHHFEVPLRAVDG